MTTLNARANQAWQQHAQIGNKYWPFDGRDQHEFEEGWEAGYKVAREELYAEIKPLGTPARDLPFGMAYDVCQVLKAYGLNVLDESLKGQGMVAVQLALVKVIQAVPPELGGRKGEEGSVS